MPWIHLHVSNQGVVRACCVANIPFGNINKQSLNEIWNGESIKVLRDKFMRGESDKRCAVCQKIEEAGGKSIRQETFEKFGDIEIVNNNTPLPVYFDIRFSNKCNFRCRTCWHGSSSGWFEEAKVLGTSFGDKAVIQNVLDFDDFISTTGEALLNAREIYFAGGEPLATPEHYLLLDWLVEHKATNMKLRYNTNFSTLSLGQRDILSYWNKFSDIDILASIDASDKLGEYIRKGMNWQKILENRERIRELDNVKFQIAPTISVFNILQLPELYKLSLKLNLIEPLGLYINILERPYHYNVKALPLSYKKEVEQKYKQFFVWLDDNDIPSQIKKKFVECLDYMMAEDKSKHWKRFIKETATLDKLRGENINDLLF